MKVMVMIFSMVAIVGSAYAAPVLVYKSGGIASSGVTKTCEVSESAAVLNNIDVHGLIATASRATISTALHIQATVPSIEIYGVRNVRYPINRFTSGIRAERVLLFQDYSNMQTRDGAEAAQLVQLTEQACGIR